MNHHKVNMVLLRCDNSLVATTPSTLGFDQPLNWAWSAWGQEKYTSKVIWGFNVTERNH